MEQDGAEIKIVVGLGNPGQQYRNTRHNIGFMVLKQLGRRWETGRGRLKFHARCRQASIGGRTVILASPQTYMNRSGLAVAEVTTFYKADPSAILVVLDDLALPLGRLRARASGSAGGHKGLGDILKMLDTNRLARLRIGIDAPPEGIDSVDYVLRRFSSDEKPVIAKSIELAADAVEDWVSKGITYVMDHYNSENGCTENSQHMGKDQ